VNGRVFGRQPRIEVVLVLADQRRLFIEHVIDTGFDGFLMLPSSAVAAMGLPFLYRLDANLADNRRKSTPVHEGTMIWHGNMITVQVLAMGRRPLLGTMLLDGYKLTIPFRDGEPLTVEAM
jgi:clan AA aspartic protease